MPNYELIFREREGEPPIRTVTFSASDPHEALLIAQRHDSPGELWEDGRHVCTLSKSGGEHEFWVITPAKQGDPSRI